MAPRVQGNISGGGSSSNSESDGSYDETSEEELEDDDESSEEEDDEDAEDDGWTRQSPESTKLDDAFTSKVDDAVRAEFVGATRAARQLCKQFGYDPKDLPDVVMMFMQDMLSVMRRHLAAGFQRRTSRGLDLGTLVRFIVCVSVAGTYNEAYSNLAADFVAHGDERNAFMRFDAEMSNDDFAALAREIDARTEGVRPGSADPLIEELRTALCDSFSRVLSYMRTELDVYLLLGVDDLQSKGVNAFLAGVVAKYNKMKATKLGPVCIFAGSGFLRLPIGFIQETLDGKERGEKIGPLLVDALKRQLDKHGVPFDRIVADFDRGSGPMKRAFAEEGGKYVATIQKPGPRNKQNRFSQVKNDGDDPPKYHVEGELFVVAENGPPLSVFVTNENLGVTQVAQRVKNRITYLETNVLELQGAVLGLSAKPPRAFAPSANDVVGDVEARAALLSHVRLLVADQRTAVWRNLRKGGVVTSTGVIHLARLDAQWQRNYELCGSEYTGIAGLVMPDDGLDEGEVAFVERTTQNDDVRVYPSACPADLERSRRHMQLIQRLRLSEEPHLPADLAGVAGDLVDDAPPMALVKAARALQLDGASDLKVKNMDDDDADALRERIREAREDYAVPANTFASMLDQGDKSFAGTRATKGGIVLEPLVRAKLPEFVSASSKGASRLAVFDAEGLYESLASPYCATSPDGLFVLQSGISPREVGIVEIKCLEDTSALQKVADAKVEFGRVRIKSKMSDAELAAVKKHIPDHADHIPQLLHHAAVFNTRLVLYCTAAAREGGAIKRVLIFEFDQAVLDDHVFTFDLVGRCHAPWLADPECERPYPPSVDAEVANMCLTTRRLLRSKAPLGQGAVGGKSAVAVAHNVCKTPADTLHAEIIRSRFDSAGRGARFNQVVDMIHIGVITATRIHAAMGLAESLGVWRTDFDRSDLPSLKQLRRDLNKRIGGMRARIRDFARELKPDRYGDIHVPIFPVAPGTLAAALEQVQDADWLPNQPEFWNLSLKLRDAANAGANQAAAWNTDKILVAFRTHTSGPHHHVHEKVKIGNRRRCIIGCTKCPEDDAHSREGPTSSFMCSRCGVVLSCTEREEFGNRSSWDVFHNDQVLPAHPYTGEPQASAASASPTAPHNVLPLLDARPASHSALKRRSTKRFRDTLIEVGATRANLAETFTGPSGAV